MNDERKLFNPLDRVERIIRARVGAEEDEDGDAFVVERKCVGAKQWIFTARLLRGGVIGAMCEVTATLENDTRPKHDVVALALYAEAVKEVQRQRAALDAAVDE